MPKVFEALSDLDKDLEFFAVNLANYNPQALIEWKKILWENTEHWATLLPERAAITGKN